MGVPVVVTPFAHRGAWGDDPGSAAAYRSAERVIALLETEAQLYCDVGVSREKIEICGVCSPAMQTGGGKQIRAEFSITGPLVLFVGVRRPYKGFDRLLSAAPMVTRRVPGVTFGFVGPGAPIESPPGTQVIDAGMVDDETKAAWLDAADLLCLPSDDEIMPVSVLEAWSLSTPVLTSDIPSLRELVGRGGGGRTSRTDPETFSEAIVELIQADETRAKLGRAGHDFWERHCTVEVVARWHENLYRTLVEEGQCAA